jgi:UDP-N-acetylmuramate--alanine ligase
MAVVEQAVLQDAAGCGDALAWLRAPTVAHLVGTGGCGMRALAQVFLDLDCAWTLSGSDADLSALRAMSNRMRLHQDHDAAHLPANAELVIRSDAVPDTNPELAAARRRGIPVCSYFEFLGQMTRRALSLAVAGTHGKSTTTAMAGRILIAAGFDPTLVYGASPLGQSSGGRAGRGPWLLVEACEYRANFLHLWPKLGVILGIEPDHFDYYRTPAQLQQAFADFAARLPSDGRLLVRHDCPPSRAAALATDAAVETFGLGHEADWQAQVLGHSLGRHRFRLLHAGRPLGEIALAVPGRHQVLNALAAAALASSCGVAAEHIVAGLEGFAGLHRRLERLHTWRGVERCDDYAHHPTEVAATLAAVRQMYPGRKVWCVFQPHQASRTARLLDELAASLDNSDQVFIAEIYRAREPQYAPGDVSAADLARKLRSRGTSAWEIHAPSAIADALKTHLQPGDVLVTLGAGDIGKIHHEFDERI